LGSIARLWSRCLGNEGSGLYFVMFEWFWVVVLSLAVTVVSVLVLIKKQILCKRHWAGKRSLCDKYCCRNTKAALFDLTIQRF